MSAKGAGKFDFGFAGKENDNDWMSVDSGHKIALSDAPSSDDCQVVNVGRGDGFYDMISESDGFDVYSMVSIDEFGDVKGDTGTGAKNKNNFCYTPSNKSQLRVKMLSNSFADDSMSMASAPKLSP